MFWRHVCFCFPPLLIGQLPRQQIILTYVKYWSIVWWEYTVYFGNYGECGAEPRNVNLEGIDKIPCKFIENVVLCICSKIFDFVKLCEKNID